MAVSGKLGHCIRSMLDKPIIEQRAIDVSPLTKQYSGSSFKSLSESR